MPFKDPTKRKKYLEERKEKIKEYMKTYYEDNKEKIKEQKSKYYEDLNQHAYNYISFRKINDKYKWDLWCNKLKSCATKHPYSDDFTNYCLKNYPKDVSIVETSQRRLIE
jgi:hypothetical protein